MSCDLCGSTDARPVMKKHGRAVQVLFTIVRCTGCGLVYVNPRLPDEQMQGLYDEEYYQGRGFDRTINYVESAQATFAAGDYGLVTTLAEAVGGDLRGKTSLDIGCGTGGLVAALRAEGAEAIGMDWSEAALEICRRRGIPVTNQSIDDLVAQGKMFDFITAIEVIEHVTSPTAFLQSISRLIKPGGVLYVTTGNWNLVRFDRGTPYVMPEGHIYYFTPVTLRKLFAKAGLQTKPVSNRSWIGWRLAARCNRYLPFAKHVVPLLERVVRSVFPGVGPFPIGIKP